MTFLKYTVERYTVSLSLSTVCFAHYTFSSVFRLANVSLDKLIKNRSSDLPQLSRTVVPKSEVLSQE